MTTVEALPLLTARSVDQKGVFLERLDELRGRRQRRPMDFYRAAGISREAFRRIRQCATPRIERGWRLIHAATLDPAEARHLSELLFLFAENQRAAEAATQKVDWWDLPQVEAVTTAGIRAHARGQFAATPGMADQEYRSASVLFRLVLQHLAKDAPPEMLIQGGDSATRLSDIDRLHDLGDDSLEHARYAEQLALRARDLPQLLHAVRSKGIAYNNLERPGAAVAAYEWVLTRAKLAGVEADWLRLVGRDLVNAQAHSGDAYKAEPLARALLRQRCEEAPEGLDVLLQLDSLGRVLLAGAR